MPVTVNVEDFSEGPAESVRKAQLLVDAITELQQDVTQLELLVNVGGGGDGTTQFEITEDAELNIYAIRAQFVGAAPE